MIFRIDTTTDVAIFAQVAGAVRAEVASGKLVPGDKLPAAREVAMALGINVHTVLRAYQDLRDEGLIDVRRGRGATVTEAANALAGLADDIRDLVARARALGLSVDTLSSLVKEASE